MTRPRKQSVTMLVWTLVMVGLVAMVVTNSIIGWTISGLNQEQQYLKKLDSQLTQTSQKLHRLIQLTQNWTRELLQQVPLDQTRTFPLSDFAQLQIDFQQSDSSPEMATIIRRMDEAVAQLQQLWDQADAWRELQLQIVSDQQHKKTLSRAHNFLNQLRDSLESLEGRQRLKEALLIRQWRSSRDSMAFEHTETLLRSQSSVGKRVLAECKTEMMDLARMVESLAGENQPGQLTDLKDNQLKPNLERIGQLLAILYSEKLLNPQQLPPTLLTELQESLFGKGYAVYNEYQTIHPGTGGLYQLTRTRLEQRQAREDLLQQSRSAFRQLESILPDLTDLTRKRSMALTAQAAALLGHGASNMLLLSIVTLFGFLGLGWLFANLARKQVTALEERDKELNELNRSLEEKVTERTTLLEEKSLELIRAREKLLLHEKLVAIGTLATGVAHEINNPVAIIRGNTEVLQMKLADRISELEELNTITKQVDRVSLITQNMLSFAGRKELQKEPVQLHDLLEEVLAQINHQVPLGSITIHRELATSLPTIPGDYERLKQVINNIILNALQAMNGLGELTLKSVATARGVELSIRDTGCGIQKNHLEKIFNPFFTTKKHGTGLGLAVSYGIIQAHNGVINVTSTPNEGTSFHVMLPTRRYDDQSLAE